ncbi:MAG: hypothetical protein NVSMB9_15440 [Isosphaeraceae bacterium]
MGASAGGQLALLLGRSREPSVDGLLCETKALGIRALIDFYGPTDLFRLHEQRAPARSSIEMMLGGSPTVLADEYRSASPLFGVSPASPPVLIIHGSEDRLIPLEQSRALAKALREAKVPHRLIVIDGARHGFGLRVGTRDLTPEIMAFLKDIWEASETKHPLR